MRKTRLLIGVAAATAVTLLAACSSNSDNGRRKHHIHCRVLGAGNLGRRRGASSSSAAGGSSSALGLVRRREFGPDVQRSRLVPGGTVDTCLWHPSPSPSVNPTTSPRDARPWPTTR